MRINIINTTLYKYPILLFIAFLVLVYLPVLLPFFHVKNDLITQNLPARFFVSESLYSGYFPWWNPFLNYGTPQYGDMNVGFWNPFMWIIAKTTGYNVLTITLEELFYILIGGWGTYKLAEQLKIKKEIAIVCGLSYMSGGYILGHLQYLCWITGTAFFPFVLLFYLRSIYLPKIQNFILGGSFSFLFIASTHPGLIIGGIYFFIFLFAHLLFIEARHNDSLDRKTIIKSSLLFGLTALLFSPIVIYSNIEVLQHITRGSKVSIDQSLLAPTSFQSYLSLLLPLAVHKGSFFYTDIAMRNMSIGILLLPGFYNFFRKTSIKRSFIIVIGIIFFCLLSAGGVFKLLAYHLLPFIGFVRLNGEFAYFVYLPLILIAGHGLSVKVGKSPSLSSGAFRHLMNVMVVAILIAFVAILINHNSILFHPFSNATLLKKILDHISFWDLLFLSALIQIITLLVGKKYFFIGVVINLVLISWSCLPFTGLGQTPRSYVQKIISTFPKGIQKPFQINAFENVYIDTKFDPIIACAAFYSKQIGYTRQPPYPVLLKNADDFYRNKQLASFIRSQAYLFLATDTLLNAATISDSSLLEIKKFGPTYIDVNVRNKQFTYLILLQNNYPRWQVFLDGKPVKHFLSFTSFIGITIPEGVHKVEYKFETKTLQVILLINIIMLLAAIFLLTQKSIRSNKI